MQFGEDGDDYIEGDEELDDLEGFMEVNSSPAILAL